MTSSRPNTASSSRGGVVPRAPNVGHDPRHGPTDLRSQLHEMSYNGRRFMAFVAILLGDDEVLDEGVTGNKRVNARGVSSSTDHNTMQLPHGGELTYPTTTLWLPENLKNSGATLGYKDGEDFLNNMKTILIEVLRFGPRATDVAQAFARMEFDRVKPVLFSVKKLRVALKALLKGMETKLPLMDPLLPNILDTSAGFVPRASYILAPLVPGVGSDAEDIPSKLRARYYRSKQYYIFLSILLGEDQPRGEDATVHDRGGALSVTDHDSLQTHGVPKPTVWLPEYLKKGDAIPGYSVSHYWDQLMGLFRVVMEFGAYTTDLAKELARLKIERAEYLIDHPEALRTMLPRIDAIAKDNDTRELIKMFIPEVETDTNTDIPLYAVPEELLPDVEPLDDDYIKMSVFRYFGQM